MWLGDLMITALFLNWGLVHSLNPVISTHFHFWEVIWIFLTMLNEWKRWSNLIVKFCSGQRLEKYRHHLAGEVWNLIGSRNCLFANSVYVMLHRLTLDILKILGRLRDASERFLRPNDWLQVFLCWASWKNPCNSAWKKQRRLGGVSAVWILKPDKATWHTHNVTGNRQPKEVPQND